MAAHCAASFCEATSGCRGLRKDCGRKLKAQCRLESSAETLAIAGQPNWHTGFQFEIAARRPDQFRHKECRVVIAKRGLINEFGHGIHRALPWMINRGH